VLKVSIEEEYGWKNWIWTAPFDSEEDLVEWWQGINVDEFMKVVWSRRTDVNPPYADFMGGEWETDDGTYDFEGVPVHIHIHEDHDTTLSHEGYLYHITGEKSFMMPIDSDSEYEDWYEGAGGHPNIFNPDDPWGDGEEE